MDFEIIDYTEKSIAIFGDTRSIKDDLKALGGRFNPRLNYNGGKAAGWIFPIDMRDQIEELLEMSDEDTDTEVTFEIDKTEKYQDPDNGDLPKCIKLLCKHQGKDIIFNDKFVNALSDYNAFSIPLYKNILKVLVREGYLNSFESKDKWNKIYQQTINNICYNFGWSEPIIRYILDSIAYGLNYLRKKPINTDVNCKVAYSNAVSLFLNELKTTEKHFSFKGIEINGSPENIRTQLESKGFSFRSRDGNYIFLEGNFAANENCGITIISNHNLNLVWCIQVNLPKQYVWDNLKTEYMYYKKWFTQKYGDPVSDEFFRSPYEEGDGYEMTAISSYNCHYCSFFYTTLGRIEVSIASCGGLCISYIDNYNFNLHTETKDNQAYLDI